MWIKGEHLINLEEFVYLPGGGATTLNSIYVKTGQYTSIQVNTGQYRSTQVTTGQYRSIKVITGQYRQWRN